MHGSEAVDLAWLASGRLDATVMLSSSPWDVSGGVLLVREAGGVVCDAGGATAPVALREHPGLGSAHSRSLCSELVAEATDRAHDPAG